MSAMAVEVENISLRFGDTFALRDVSFAVAPSTFTAIIGPNGAGKSTLLKVILGLLTPGTGSVSVLGQDARSLERGIAAYVPQKKTFAGQFPATVLELVVSGLTGTWPWRISRSQREQALSVMERTGVGALANQSVQALSGGELQRAFLARSLVSKPQLLLLDEPAAGMDIRGEAAMYHLLGDYQAESGATVMMITHDWEGARCHADQVLLLNRSVVGFGPAQEAASEERLLSLFGHRGHVHETHAGAVDD
jgi:zinc transport system ATP-binding protein